MPTAGKLLGAATFGILIWLVSGLIPPLLPEGTPTPLLQPVNAAVGFVLGWTMVGRNAGDGIVATIGHASTTTVAVVFWCLVIWSGDEMLDRATRLLYDGPIEALQDMAVLALEYGRLVATPQIIGAMLLGTLICAVMTESAASRWS
ncbi:MAG: TrgA family protein [Paracoccaceae bacterium]|nr:TrgA family protein [Paracoccaceae bacterium]